MVCAPCIRNCSPAGGYIIIDDYALEPCRMAVTAYRREQGIEDEMKSIDWTGVYWKRSS